MEFCHVSFLSYPFNSVVHKFLYRPLQCLFIWIIGFVGKDIVYSIFWCIFSFLLYYFFLLFLPVILLCVIFLSYTTRGTLLVLRALFRWSVSSVTVLFIPVNHFFLPLFCRLVLPTDTHCKSFCFPFLFLSPIFVSFYQSFVSS